MQEKTSQGFELKKNIAYANHDGVELTGDLYLPAGPGPHPLIVNVHGGYWRRGSRDTFQHWGPYLSERGIAGFTISYRLTKKGQSTFPKVVHDVRAAVQFMRGNAAQYRLNPDRFALWGNSAGAHLAALVALAGDKPLFKDGYPNDPHNGVSTKVKVLIGTYGIYDLVAQWKYSQIQNPGDNLVESMLGASLVQNRKLYFDASPISYATTDNNKAAAAFIIWGTEDDTVDYKTQSLEFLTALKQAEFQARPCIVHGAPHYWLSDPIDEPGSHSGFVAPRLMRFLAERL